MVTFKRWVCWDFGIVVTASLYSSRFRATGVGGGTNWTNLTRDSQTYLAGCGGSCLTLHSILTNDDCMAYDICKVLDRSKIVGICKLEHNRWLISTLVHVL